MTLPDSVVAAAIGRQVGGTNGKAVGAPPTFGFGVTGGKVIDWTVAQDALMITNANPGFYEAERKSVVPGAQLNTVGYSQLLGLLLYAILGNDVVTGVTPKLHTITAANEPIPYLTVFGRWFDQYTALVDGKIDQLDL